MKHLVCEPREVGCLSVGVWGPSVPHRGSFAERSFWGQADVLVFSGSPAALAAVRVAFSAAPGVFALGVVRAIDRVLVLPPRAPFLPGV
jgi:uncharacterized membrane protein YpjA